VASDPALVTMLREAPKPLAVIASNDHIGRVVCIAAENLGFTVPTEVAVLGAGNLSAARTAFPPLSSVEVPAEEMGYRATELLMRLINGESIPKKQKCRRAR
jgi:LacI family transcriptional regulator